MPRPPYQITKTDYAAALRYIQNGIQRGEISGVDGYRVLRRADTPEKLQRWCDDYLPTEIFKKLKGAVVAARKRARDYKTPKSKKGIDLDYQAYLSLVRVAEDLGVSFSDAVICLEEVYWRAKEEG